MKTQQFQKALTFALPMEHYEKIKQITDDREDQHCRMGQGCRGSGSEQH